MNHEIVHLALLLGRLGLLAFGNGNAVLTELQHQAVANGWMSAQQFRDAYALAQISPGPGPLMVVFVGYMLAGIPGGLLAVAAFFFPPAVSPWSWPVLWGAGRIRRLCACCGLRPSL